MIQGEASRWAIAFVVEDAVECARIAPQGVWNVKVIPHPLQIQTDAGADFDGGMPWPVSLGLIGWAVV